MAVSIKFRLTVIVAIVLHLISCCQVLSFAVSIGQKSFATDEPGASCCLCQTHQERQSAIHSLKESISEIVSQYMIVPECGEGVWFRVAYLNMNDSTQECPSNWTEISSPVRTCGRPASVGAPSCPGVFYSTQSLWYSKVCGRVIGYQDGSTDAFRSTDMETISVDGYYVDGVSVTHGGVPRTHIWTYASGAVDSDYHYITNCPCASQPGVSPLSFIGNNYFCESGNHGQGTASRVEFFQDDPLWDGEQCEGECCSNGKSPPWFSVTLSDPTTDDIEVRICGDEGTDNEDTPIQLLEIYIQ